MIYEFFNWCVWVFEVIGDITGLGYFLANIIVFVIIQPSLIILFFVLWISERQRNKKIAIKTK